MIYSQCFQLPFHEGLWFYDPKSATFFPSSLISLEKGFKKKKAEIAKIRKRLGSRLTSHRRRSLAKLLNKTLKKKESFSKRIAFVKENKSLTFQKLKEDAGYLRDYYDAKYTNSTALVSLKTERLLDLKRKYDEKEALVSASQTEASEAIEDVKNLEIIYKKHLESGRFLSSTLHHTRNWLIKAQKKASYFTEVLEEAKKEAAKMKTLFYFSRYFVFALRKRVNENFKKMKFTSCINNRLFKYYSLHHLSNDEMAYVMKYGIEDAKKKSYDLVDNLIKYFSNKK